MPAPRRQAGGTLLGLALIGRGRREGLAHFDGTVQGFLSSLAPWIAFALVDGLLFALDRRPLMAATLIAFLLCLVLLPPVISELIARAWGRDGRWLRYVTASTWAGWLMLFVTAAANVADGLLMTAGLPSTLAAGILILAVAGYWLWLHAFVARSALDLSWLRASVVAVALFSGMVATIGLGWEVGGNARAMLTLDTSKSTAAQSTAAHP